MRAGLRVAALVAAASGAAATPAGTDEMALVQQSLQSDQAGPFEFVKAFVTNNYDDIQDLLQPADAEADAEAELPAGAVSLERKPGEAWANKVQRKMREAQELNEVRKQYAPTVAPAISTEAKCDKKDKTLLMKVPKMLLEWKGMPNSCKPETMMSPQNELDRRGAFSQMSYCVKDFLDVSDNCTSCAVNLMKALWLGKGPAAEYCKTISSHCQGLTPDEINKPCGQSIAHCMSLAETDINNFVSCIDIPYPWYVQRLLRGVRAGFEEAWILNKESVAKIAAQAGNPVKKEDNVKKANGEADYMHPYGFRRKPNAHSRTIQGA